MASPMVEGRSLNPREKAHFSLHLSDSITEGDVSLGSFSSVKYNHKPRQTTASRVSTIKPTGPDRYTLTLQDKEEDQRATKTTFTGQKQAPKRSYVLLFDSTSQRATLEPLSSTYTFNLATENGKDKASAYPKIYPKKEKDEPSPPADDDLFSDEGKGDHENDEPDPDNPFDFRHFLSKDSKDKQGNESPFVIPNSPDYRTGTGSAANTPMMGARKPAAGLPPKPKVAPPARRRKSPNVDPMVTRKPPVKKTQPPPKVVLERKATATSKPESKPAASAARKPAGRKGGQPASSKIKSAELVHSSDDSDLDADGEDMASPPPPRHSPVAPSPEPVHSHHSDRYEDDEEDDEDDDMGGGGGLEIEVPDERPSKPRYALASLGLGQTLGLGGLGHLKSPSNGPISLASVANSVEGSPNPSFTPRKNIRNKAIDDDVIDFGDLGGGGGGAGNDSDEDMGGAGRAYDDEDEDEEMEDRDVDDFDLGPPAQQNQQPSSRKMSVSAAAAAATNIPIDTAEDDEEEQDPLYIQMMQGLAGGESSEESEEE
ncbi:hypothetical protein BU24DRAFT_133886 [Aaosphaeria arxii CBS 175.79]|uniref:Transcription elongation factor Eaf N-terminal domain-containing protein n=1 Tax=Aaosphaeria arxii CBS 175.79 TaxID=1450172 RepID=A0A6A5Y6E9_9PLEO|nr:uncharacterized protein BU24DRAFT_133886 [Aaosphaeria arxii CBS 175.79]KAF2020134.1 hypothetical protein BU24DRAFT_133886 [Aaosphaeria arxii CBS 175.79]